MADAILTKKDGVVTMDKSFDYLCSTLKMVFILLV